MLGVALTYNAMFMLELTTTNYNSYAAIAVITTTTSLHNVTVLLPHFDPAYIILL